MKKEKCANCGGLLVAQKIMYEKNVGGRRVFFEDVPARICSNCDEIWIDGKTAEKMERIYQKGLKPTRRITLPVWSLSKVA